jgi:hypothetical protein
MEQIRVDSFTSEHFVAACGLSVGTVEASKNSAAVSRNCWKPKGA